jgi:CDP-alcohol phosphatidyltransferase
MFRTVRTVRRNHHANVFLCCCNHSSHTVCSGAMHCHCCDGNLGNAAIRCPPSLTTTTSARTKKIYTSLVRNTNAYGPDSSLLLLLQHLKKQQLQRKQTREYHYFKNDNFINHSLLLSSSTSSQRPTRPNNHILQRHGCNAALSLLQHQYVFMKAKNNHNYEYSSNISYDGYTSIRRIQTSTDKPIHDVDTLKSNDVAVKTHQSTAATATNNDITSRKDDEGNSHPASDYSSINKVPNSPTQQPPAQQQPFVVVVQHWLQQLRAIPNIITVSRILLIPFISYWVIQQQTMLAFIGCVYAAISDVLDGYIARRYPSMQTSLGTYLDPLGTV